MLDTATSNIDHAQEMMNSSFEHNRMFENAYTVATENNNPHDHIMSNSMADFSFSGEKSDTAMTLVCLGGAISIVVGAIIAVMTMLGTFFLPTLVLIVASYIVAALVGVVGGVIGTLIVTWHIKNTRQERKVPPIS